MNEKIYFLILILFFVNGLEVDIENREEFCLKFTMQEGVEGSISLNALASGIGANSKFVVYKVIDSNGVVLKEQKKQEEFHFTINDIKFNDQFKFCFKDMDGTKKSIIFNKFEEIKISNKPILQDSFENLRIMLQDLLEKLRKIEQGIVFRETLASNHIEVSEQNLKNIKYGSLAKLFIVAVITILQIFVLMRFIEKKEKVFAK